MKRTNLNKLTAVACLALGALTGRPADAVPVSGQFHDDGRCDALPDQLIPRELGDVVTFPVNSAFAYHDHRYHIAVGVPDDGIANDWSVHLTNLSGQAWRDLYFVADGGATIGNADGKVEDLLGAPGAPADAFRIDALGVNANLIMESIAADGIFQAGEEWEFVVTNFGTGLNSLPPELKTPGVFAGSSPLGQTAGNASILAAPVPEPMTVGPLLFAGAALLMRHRPAKPRRARRTPRRAQQSTN